MKRPAALGVPFYVFAFTKQVKARIFYERLYVYKN